MLAGSSIEEAEVVKVSEEKVRVEMRERKDYHTVLSDYDLVLITGGKGNAG